MPSPLSIAAPASVNPSARSVAPPASQSCTFRSPFQAPSSLVDRDCKPAGTPSGKEPIGPVSFREGNSTRLGEKKPAAPPTGVSRDASTRPGPGLSCTSPASSTRRKRSECVRGGLSRVDLLLPLSLILKNSSITPDWTSEA